MATTPTTPTTPAPPTPPTYTFSNWIYGKADKSIINVSVQVNGGAAFPFSYVSADTAPVSVAVKAYLAANPSTVIAAYVAPAPITVTVVSSLQAKLALNAAGLMPQVQSAIAADTSGNLSIWYNNTQNWNISSPQLLGVASTLKLTTAQVQTLFNQAAAIQI